MATDVYKLIQQSMASNRRSDTTMDRTPELIMQGLSWMSSRNETEKIKNRDSLNTIVSLYNQVDSPEGMRNVVSAMDSLHGKSGDDADVQASINMLRVNADNWTKDYNTYTNAVDRGAELVDSDSFPQDIEDYQNLDQLAYDAEFRNADGTGNKIKYLFAEKEKILSLMDNISVGASPDGKSRRFRYNGKDTSVVRKLQKHNRELDIAIRALAGDGILTDEEAYHVQVGDSKFYETKYKENIESAKFMVKENLDTISKLESFRSRTEKGMIDTTSSGMFNMNPGTTDSTGALTDESIKTLLEDIDAERVVAIGNVKNANKRYKEWAGKDFGDFNYLIGDLDKSTLEQDNPFEEWQKKNPNKPQEDYEASLEKVKEEVVEKKDEKEDKTLSLTKGGVKVGEAKNFKEFTNDELEDGLKDLKFQKDSGKTVSLSGNSIDNEIKKFENKIKSNKEVEQKGATVDVWNYKTGNYNPLNISNYVTSAIKLPRNKRGVKSIDVTTDEYKNWKKKFKEDTGWSDTRVTKALNKLKRIAVAKDKDKLTKDFNEWMQKGPATTMLAGKPGEKRYYRNTSTPNLVLEKSRLEKLLKSKYVPKGTPELLAKTIEELQNRKRI